MLKQNPAIHALVLLTLLAAQVASAESLSSYRGSSKVVAARKAEVEAFSAKIMKLLGRDQLNFTPLTYRAVTVTPDESYRRVTSSTIVKMNLDSVVRELIREERYGKPMTFTPSSTQHTWEAEEAARQFRIQACRKILAKKSPHAMKQALDEFHLLSRSPPESRKKIETAATPETAQTVAKLEKTFGKLSGVQIVENAIFGFKFTDKTSSTTITLSMVLTALSDEDDAFVSVLDCLLSEVKIQLKAATARETEFAELSSTKNRLKSITNSDITKRKEALQKQIATAMGYNQAYYQGLSDFLTPKLDGARRFNAQFKTLALDEKAALLEALLRAQQDQIASLTESEVLSEQIGKLSNDLYKTEPKSDRLARLAADGAYFRQIPNQMSRLYDRLIEKKQIEAQTRKLKKEIEASK